MSRDEDPPEGRLLPFEPRARRERLEPFRSLGLSQRALADGPVIRQLTGHWCSGCEGIWFGYPLEVECPACGNRDG